MLYRFVSLQMLYWYGFCDVSVTLYDFSVLLSKETLNVHPRSDSKELAEVAPIVVKMVLFEQW